MQRYLGIGAILTALLCVPLVRADDAEPPATPRFAAERFYRDVRHVVKRHYPGATTHRLGDKIHFERDTRIFIVHVPLKTGEWQDPWEERGPKRGGVHGDIEFRRGKYGGAAAVPQTFDRHYFTVLLLAPYSAALDGYLYVHLKLPANGGMPDGFVKEVTALINDFGSYAEA